MKKIIFYFSILVFFVACKQNNKDMQNSVKASNNIEGTRIKNINTNSDSMTLFAEKIIYDVILQAESEDSWLKETVAGYKGSEMINSYFDAIYSGELKVFDFHTNKQLSSKDIKKLEESEDFSRENIAKIQFTENWYYNKTNLTIEKRIVSVVFGYRSSTSDDKHISYIAAFKVDF